MPLALLIGFIGYAVWAVGGHIELAPFIPLGLARFFTGFGAPKILAYALTWISYELRLPLAFWAVAAIRWTEAALVS